MFTHHHTRESGLGYVHLRIRPYVPGQFDQVEER
jgi:hypothetical protein